MFKHLVVPLDGSRLAEAALPAAGFIAERMQSRVTLLHIVERDAPPSIHGERHLTDADEAYAYLDEVARTAFAPDLTVDRHVHTVATTDVARSIVLHIEELAPDLIVMCTHGQGGLRDVMYGNIAQQVVALGTSPVLMITPGPLNQAGGVEEPPAFSCRSILVPLDGSADHEQGLPVAADMARVCGSEVSLVFVVPTLGTLSGQQAATGLLLPGATRALLDLAEQEAVAYLTRWVTEMQVQGIPARGKVSRGDPVAEIVAAAADLHADLVVVGTHGKAGMDAFWEGSVTPKLASRSRLPLLLVPVAQSPTGG